MKKYYKGFTLAEVLVTLTILGVIAALLTPILLNAAYKKETPAKLEKFYLTMASAVREAEQEGDKYSTEWDYTLGADAFYDKYLSHYLSGGRKPEGGYFLNDGSNYTIEKSEGNDCMEFVYDLNGANEPDIFGVDKFAFVLCSNSPARKNRLKGFETYNLSGTGDITRDELLEKCSQEDDDGKYCTRLLQVDGWEYRDDYPWAE